MLDSPRFRDGTSRGGLANMTAALLLSGGMDSVAIAYWKRPRYGITINYGQEPAEGEIRACKRCLPGARYRTYGHPCGYLGTRKWRSCRLATRKRCTRNGMVAVSESVPPHGSSDEMPFAGSARADDWSPQDRRLSCRRHSGIHRAHERTVLASGRRLGSDGTRNQFYSRGTCAGVTNTA